MENLYLKAVASATQLIEHVDITANYKFLKINLFPVIFIDYSHIKKNCSAVMKKKKNVHKANST